VDLQSILTQLFANAGAWRSAAIWVDKNKRYPTPPRLSERIPACLPPLNTVERRPRGDVPARRLVPSGGVSLHLAVGEFLGQLRARRV